MHFKTNSRDFLFLLPELWFGTHISGPSEIGLPQTNGSVAYQPLATYLASNYPQYQDGLPYLLKVLSIRTALSIQAHPDAGLAKELHKKFPSIYKDPNHKPELAIAITPMDAMCSFRPIKEIAHFLETVPELRRVVGEAVAESFLSHVAHFEPSPEFPYEIPTTILFQLRALFEALMTAPQATVTAQLEILLSRLPSTLSTDADWTYLVGIIQSISKEMPNDVGVLAVFLLNVIRLQPGEAIFLAQNEPHAYIHGDCVECMATSDNVVRAGLTPKFKDVDTLIRMLTYKCGRPFIYRGEAVPNSSELRYAPPVEEFLVDKYEVAPNTSVSIAAIDSPSIVLTVRGSGTLLPTTSAGKPSEVLCPTGASHFVAPNTSGTLRNNGHTTLLVFRAAVAQKQP